jgi:hypothetical protein
MWGNGWNRGGRGVVEHITVGARGGWALPREAFGAGGHAVAMTCV